MCEDYELSPETQKLLREMAMTVINSVQTAAGIGRDVINELDTYYGMPDPSMNNQPYQ